MQKEIKALMISVAILSILASICVYQYNMNKDIISTYEQRLLKMDSNLKQLSISFEENKLQIESLKTELSEKENQLSRKQSRIEELRTKLSLLQKEINDLTGELSEKNDEILQKQKTIERLQTEIQEQVVEIKKLSQTIETLENKIRELQAVDLRANIQNEYYPKFWPWDTDCHVVDGVIINYGTTEAKNVIVIMRWVKEGRIDILPCEC
jgi:peptidoglycan hydrolase CwlO-like protein